MRYLVALLSLVFSVPASAQVDYPPMPLSMVISDIMQYTTPANAATIVMTKDAGALIINNSALLITLGIVLPPEPEDGQRVSIMSASGITLMTISAPGSATVKGTVASLAVNSYARFIYSAQANAWFRAG